jgi:hypothetical protein
MKIDEDIFEIWGKWRSIPCWLRYLHDLEYPQETLDTLEYIDDQFNIFADVEKKWHDKWRRENLPRNESEWLDVFPETRAIIPEKIKEWHECEQATLSALRLKLSQIDRSSSDLNKLISREWLKLNEAADVAAARRHIRRLSFATAPKSNSSRRISNVDIEAARAAPIQTLLSNITLKPSGRNLKGLCPLHEERTPSFCLYPDTNSFYCFGCHKGGGPIELAKFLYNYKFPDAVHWLTGKSRK